MRDTSQYGYGLANASAIPSFLLNSPRSPTPPPRRAKHPLSLRILTAASLLGARLLVHNSAIYFSESPTGTYMSYVAKILLSRRHSKR